VIYQESSFNPNAVGPTNDLGIAQFIPSTAASLGVNPLDPTSSINGAAQLLANNYAQTGNWFQAVQLYNGSLSNPATTTYANNVFSNLPNFGGNAQSLLGAGAAAVATGGASLGSAAGNASSGITGGVLNTISKWFGGFENDAVFFIVGIVLFIGAVYMFAVSQGAAPSPREIIVNSTKAAGAAALVAE
jgi:hypothetical protein